MSGGVTSPIVSAVPISSRSTRATSISDTGPDANSATGFSRRTSLAIVFVLLNANRQDTQPNARPRLRMLSGADGGSAERTSSQQGHPMLAQRGPHAVVECNDPMASRARLRSIRATHLQTRPAASARRLASRATHPAGRAHRRRYRCDPSGGKSRASHGRQFAHGSPGSARALAPAPCRGRLRSKRRGAPSLWF